MENKNTAILIVLSSLILLTAMIGATFAYFTATITGIQNKVTLQSATMASANAEGTPVSLIVTAKDMVEHDASNDYTSYIESDDPGILKLSVTTGSSSVECTYDIIYKPIDVYYRSVSNVNGLREFTIRGEQKIISGSDYSEISGKIEEFDLTDLQATTTLVSGAKFIVHGLNTTAQVSWEIVPRYYNLDIVQNDNSDKTFGGSVEVGSLVCLNS